MMMRHDKTLSQIDALTTIQIGLASGASFDTVPAKQRNLWFQDLVRLGYFSKHYVMDGENVSDINYRNCSSMAITVDGKVVAPGAFVEW